MEKISARLCVKLVDDVVCQTLDFDFDFDSTRGRRHMPALSLPSFLSFFLYNVARSRNRKTMMGKFPIFRVQREHSAAGK